MLAGGDEVVLEHDIDPHTVGGFVHLYLIFLIFNFFINMYINRLLQRFLRELPEPLLSLALFDEFVAAKVLDVIDHYWLKENNKNKYCNMK